LPGETAMLYELGIPVVETGDKWHVNVLQKVPLNSERDNVTPAYLRSIRVTVLNQMHDRLKGDDVVQHWVSEAADDDSCSPEAIKTFMTEKYGEKRVAYDPSDPEANKTATAFEFTVIPSRGLTPGQRANAYSAGVLETAGSKFPTPKPFSPGGKPAELIRKKDWTPGMQRVAELARWLAEELIGGSISVLMVKEFNAAACYGNRQLMFNVSNLGKGWFENIGVEQIDLLIHELGHEYESNHLSHAYNDALSSLAAKLAMLVFQKPEIFRYFLGPTPADYRDAAPASKAEEAIVSTTNLMPWLR
jgi:hypothetical protein